jgi:quercetin dioxygenase-like cupin family protein
MTPSVLPGPADLVAIRAWYASFGLSPYQWSNGPHDRYAAHAHDYDKYLACVSGSIVFHLGDRDLELTAGDRMILPAGTRHSADVGPNGVVCLEAAGPAR